MVFGGNRSGGFNMSWEGDGEKGEEEENKDPRQNTVDKQSKKKKKNSPLTKD